MGTSYLVSQVSVLYYDLSMNFSLAKSKVQFANQSAGSDCVVYVCTRL